MSTCRDYRLNERWWDVRCPAARIGCLAAIWLAAVGQAAAEDRVVTIDRRGREVIRSGEILDYDARELTLRLARGNELRIPADQVQSIDTTRSAPQQIADQRYEQRDYATALSRYRDALHDESRVWMKRHLWAQTIRCARNLGQIGPAISAFRVLVEQEPQTRELDAVPLAWTGTAGDGALERQLRPGLDEVRQPWVRLMAASWLLAGPHRSTARSTLQQLIRDDDPHVRMLAQTQLWRTRMATATDEQLQQWEEQLEQLPELLRAGPHYVLGRALASRSPNAAVLHFLRLPLLYPEQHDLAAESLAEAARLLAANGQTGAAERLRRELVQDYPQTMAARHAAQQMQ